MRPTIDQHDYEFKMKAMKKFLGSGDKVKVTLRFRGRELAHKELGMELMDRVKNDVNVEATVEKQPKLEGNQMIMILAPQ